MLRAECDRTASIRVSWPETRPDRSTLRRSDGYAIVQSNIWFDIFGGDEQTRLKSLIRKGERRDLARNSHVASGLHTCRSRAETPRLAHFSIEARAHVR